MDILLYRTEYTIYATFICVCLILGVGVLSGIFTLGEEALNITGMLSVVIILIGRLIGHVRDKLS